MVFSKNYIDGAWVNPQGQGMITVENPFTHETIASVPESNLDDVNLAVSAARRAYRAWSESSMAERVEKMQAMLAYLKTQADRIVELEVAELGSPKAFTRVAHCEYQFERIRSYIEVAQQIAFSEAFPHSLVERESVGVVVAITPWNYPLGQLVQKVIPAILMGNTVIMKPSQVTPLTAFVLMEAFDHAGFPKGVLNLVSGRGSQLGDAFACHRDVDMVSFTGSTSVGIELSRKALGMMKRISLELGGKSPAVWLKSEDYEPYVTQLMNSIFLNSGQTCTALSRLIVPREDLETIKALLKKHVSEYRVGDPMDPTVKVGPMATASQYRKVCEYIALGVEEGAQLLTGTVPDPKAEAYFVEPTIFVDVKNSMRIAQEEIFGPVLCVLTYDSLEEAIDIANDTVYGLNAAVNAPTQEAALAVARRIKAGNVYVNNAPRDVYAPFGGYKESGLGREGGLYGLLEFTQLKALFVKA